MRPILICLLIFGTIAGSAFADFSKDAAANLSTILGSLDKDRDFEVGGAQLMAPGTMGYVYPGTDKAPIWTDPATVQQLLDAIAEMASDGLNPADYHQAVLVALGTSMPKDPQTLANRDVLLTDAYVSMLYSLVFGKADPHSLDTDWNLDSFYKELNLKDEKTLHEIAGNVRASIVDGDLDRIFSRARPQEPMYQNLRKALEFYSDLAAKGGWPNVPDGPTLREGDTDPRVHVMRQRLILTKDFTGPDSGSNLYDAELAAAVTRYQARHGLTADGIAGKKTFASMNVPAAKRVDQIRVNLDRARWVLEYDVGENFVLVNIAAFRVWLVRNMEIIWTSRVQVGKPFTSTPIFTDKMIYIEFNPTWTVPASISNKSTLNHLKEDPNYLSTKNMVLLDSDGKKVDPKSVDWKSKTRMPYTVRQEPGPNNALGQVKFIFPNAHAVYLHDTPSKSKFSLADRAFSHGCIRTENPLDLATILLDDQPKWTREHIDSVLAGAKQTRVNLTTQLPVFLLYWTAYSFDGGEFNFRDDIYDRDPVVLKKLNGPLQGQARHRR